MPPRRRRPRLPPIPATTTWLIRGIHDGARFEEPVTTALPGYGAALLAMEARRPGFELVGYTNRPAFSAPWEG